MRRLPEHAVVVPAQALGELFNVLVRKAGRSRDAARTSVLAWRDAYAVGETSSTAIVGAVDLAHDHQMRIGDAVMMAVAAASECRLLLSEDLQDGFTWRGVTVTNPFGPAPHALLHAVLAETPSGDRADAAG